MYFQNLNLRACLYEATVSGITLPIPSTVIKLKIEEEKFAMLS